MVPIAYNIELFKGTAGTTFNRTFTLTNATGAAVNLTGYNARLKARLLPSDTTYVLTMTSSPAAGITVTAASGLVTLTLTAAQVLALTFLKATYNLELYSTGDAEVVIVAYGTITVNVS